LHHRAAEHRRDAPDYPTAATAIKTDPVCRPPTTRGPVTEALRTPPIRRPRAGVSLV